MDLSRLNVIISEGNDYDKLQKTEFIAFWSWIYRHNFAYTYSPPNSLSCYHPNLYH